MESQTKIKSCLFCPFLFLTALYIYIFHWGSTEGVFFFVNVWVNYLKNQKLDADFKNWIIILKEAFISWEKTKTKSVQWILYFGKDVFIFFFKNSIFIFKCYLKNNRYVQFVILLKYKFFITLFLFSSYLSFSLQGLHL